MQVRSQNIWRILIGAAIVIFVSCKKDTCNDPTNPRCENYEGCYEKVGADATFKIYENIGTIALEADTVWVDSPLILWAKNRPNSTFSWRIRTKGYSLSRNDSMVTMFSSAIMPSMPTAQFYTVTCIASVETGNCTNLTAIDSVSKVFYMWPKEYIGNWIQINYLPVFGTYAGYKQSKPGQLVYVTIFDSILTPPNLPCSFQYAGLKQNYNIIRNLAYNNFSSEDFTIAYGEAIKNKGASGFFLRSNNMVGYNQPNGCKGTRYLIDYSGFGMLDFYNSKKLSVSYTYWDTLTLQPVNDYFSGFKIN